MANLYFVIAVLFQSVVAKGAEDVCSHDGSDCRNPRALLQVASSIVHKRDANSQQEQVGPVAREQRLSAIQQGKGIGKDAPLNQAGYQSVVDQCCALEMIEFIRRVIEKEKLGYVCGEGAIAGTSLWFDCKDDGKNYAQLVEALKAATTGTCAWIGAQPDCPKPPLSCGSFPDASLPPCQSPSTSTSTTLPPVTSTTEITTQRPVTSTTEITTQPPTQPPTPPPPYKCSSPTGWGGGECVNKPSNGGLTLSGVASQIACGKACAPRGPGCCYWKPKDDLCKWFAGAIGDGAGAGGRYQCIVQ